MREAHTPLVDEEDTPPQLASEAERNRWANMSVTAKFVLLESVALLANKDDSYSSPLSNAIINDDTETARAMLYGLSPAQKFRLLEKSNKIGHTPLLYAVSSEDSADLIREMLDGLHPEQITILLGKVDITGQTPLSLAAYHGDDEVITIMFEKLSLPQKTHLLALTDKKGYTPLHLVAENGMEDIAHLLLENGADATKRCKKIVGFASSIHGGATPADLARTAGHETLAAVLYNAQIAQQHEPNWATSLPSSASSKRR